jgi:hypothetical protein
MSQDKRGTRRRCTILGLEGVYLLFDYVYASRSLFGGRVGREWDGSQGILELGRNNCRAFDCISGDWATGRLSDQVG